jgi:hypothetical protein
MAPGESRDPALRAATRTRGGRAINFVESSRGSSAGRSARKIVDIAEMFDHTRSVPA